MVIVETRKAIHATGRFKNETFQANIAYGTASHFDNLNLISLRHIKNYFKKSHPQVKNW